MMDFYQLNINVFRVINDLGKQFTFLNPAAIFVAEYTLYLLCFSILFYWFKMRSTQNRLMIIQAVISFLLAEAIGKISGLFYSHNQPFAVLPDVIQLVEHRIDNSFPSDHTILFFAISFSIWLVRKKVGAIWLLIACTVGISRIWVGVHYPIDIIVGAIIGVISAVFVYWLGTKFHFLKKWLALYEKVEHSIMLSKKSEKYKDFK